MLDNDNGVYAIGDNGDGCLGLGHEQRRASWTKVNGLDESEKVIKIQAGENCSAILTHKALYVFGCILFGEMNNKTNTPTKIPLQNVIKISLTNLHILALTKDGKLFAWGDNEDGQCGVGSNDDQIKIPTRVPIPEEYNVDDISAGFGHSMIKCTAKK